MATTHIAFVLDRSGSMGSIRRETVDVFNQQLEKARGSTDRVTLVTFSFTPDVPRFIGVNDKLAVEDYVPAGGTALYDAIGETVTMLQAVEQSDPDTSYLVIIITDGEENASTKYGRDSLSSLIKELQATDKWTFAYLGTKQDIFTINQTLGIPLGNATQFARDTVADVYRTSNIMASGVACYNDARGRGATCSVNFFSNQ